MLEKNMTDIPYDIKKPMLVDEVSSTEFYIGTSRQYSDESEPIWRIQKIWKTGNVWRFGYPDGDQNYKYIWGSRYTYTYVQ